MCQFAEANKEVLIESILRSLEKDQSAISPNCNYILDNDLVSCFYFHPELVTELQLSIDSNFYPKHYQKSYDWPWTPGGWETSGGAV